MFKRDWVAVYTPHYVIYYKNKETNKPYFVQPLFFLCAESPHENTTTTAFLMCACAGQRAADRESSGKITKWSGMSDWNWNQHEELFCRSLSKLVSAVFVKG